MYKPPILFVQGNVYSRMAGGDDETAKYVALTCHYDVTYYQRSGNGRSGRRGYGSWKSDRVNLGDAKRFPSGFTPMLVKALRGRGYEVSVYTTSKRPQKVFNWPVPGARPSNPMVAYPHQIEAITKAYESGRGVLQIPTGGGKTPIAMWLVQKLGVEVLYIVPNKLLLDQVYGDFFNEFGGSQVGRIGDGEFSPGYITISTVQTLWSRRESPEVRALLGRVQCLIIDECHTLGSIRDYSLIGKGRDGNTWYEVASACNAFFRIGLSATPRDRGEVDGGALRGMTGPVLVNMNTSNLIDGGYLAPPDVHVYRVKVSQSYSNYRMTYDNAIVKNPLRNKLIVGLCTGLASMGKIVLVTVSRVDSHGRVLYDALQQTMGDEVAAIFGSTSTPDREDILKKFRSREIKVLVGTVFKLGFNVKALDAIVLADAGKKEQSVVQRVGRVLRHVHGKRAIVIDFLDDDGGLAKRHSLYRLKYYLSEPAFSVRTTGFDPFEMVKEHPEIFDPWSLQEDDKRRVMVEGSICALDRDYYQKSGKRQGKPFIIKASVDIAKEAISGKHA